MARAKKQETENTVAVPTSLTVYDPYGQAYVIESSNALWERALASEDDRIVFDMNDIVSAMEWGWWIVFGRQNEWVASCGVPMPDHKLLYGLAQADGQWLRDKLQEFGGYVSWLEAQIGMMRGRANALKEAYKAGVLAASAQYQDKATEKNKEAIVFSESEVLRQTKRMQIEQDAVISTAQGMLDSYQKAWETVSRVVTTRVSEADLARRHP